MTNVISVLMQLESAQTKLLDYGILGIVVIGMAFFAYKMWTKLLEDGKVWRDEAIKSRGAFITLSQQQQTNSQRLINLWERESEQHRNFQNSVDIKLNVIEEKVDANPKKMREEVKNEIMQQKINLTPNLGENQ